MLLGTKRKTEAADKRFLEFVCMESSVQKAQQLFSGSSRYIVPAYQRPYVWEEEKQWQPLWTDLLGLAESRLEEQDDSHFFGAIVLKQERSIPGGISEWSVIDGQQRLTTLQIMFSALAYSAAENGVDIEARKLRRLIFHDEDKASGDDIFRFWPTTINQPAYKNIMEEDVNLRRQDDDNTIEEAWQFFRQRAEEYIAEGGDDQSFEDMRLRYGALREAAIGMIDIVVIQVDVSEKPQVVFETLNARGTPLLAADLIKNAIFDKVERQGLEVEEIHHKYWAPGLGDHDYWSAEEPTSNSRAPRADTFLMQWLSMKTGTSASTENLFDRFRRQFLEGPDAPPIEDLLQELRDDSLLIRSFPTADPQTPLGSLLRRTRVLGVNAFHPLILYLLKGEVPKEEQDRAFAALESFLVRRAIARLQASSYGALNGQVLAAVRKKPEKASRAIIEKLLASQSVAGRWPGDEEIRKLLLEEPLYGSLGRQRIFDLLAESENIRRKSRNSEKLSALPGDLHIEHIMPQSWRKNWPLEDENEDRIGQREEHIHRLGNLTLLSGSLNIKVSNSDWENKREKMFKHSLLLLNRELALLPEWDEQAIDQRGQELVKGLIERWPSPEQLLPAGEYQDSFEVDSEALCRPDEVADIWEGSTLRFRKLSSALANKPGERIVYQDLEEQLGWDRGSLASSLGGRSRSAAAKRPFRISLDRQGRWGLQMDAEHSEQIKSIDSANQKEIEKKKDQARSELNSQGLREVFDTLYRAGDEYEVNLVHPCTIHKNERKILRNGYFAKGWLFFWWSGPEDSDPESKLKAALSKPEEVLRNNNDSLRFQLANKADAEALLRVLEDV